MKSFIFILAATIALSMYSQRVSADPQKGDVFIIAETFNQIEETSRIIYLGELKNISDENITVSMSWVWRDSTGKILHTGGFGVSTVSSDIPDPFTMRVDKTVVNTAKQVDVIIEFFNRGVFYYLQFPDTNFASAPEALPRDNQTPAVTIQGDFDNDGDVDFEDFLVFVSNFGKTFN